MNFLKKLYETITSQVNSGSGTAELHSVDFIKSIRDGLIVGASAGLSYYLEKIPTLDMGQYTVLAVPVLTFLLTSAMRFLRDNKTK